MIRFGTGLLIVGLVLAVLAESAWAGPRGVFGPSRVTRPAFTAGFSGGSGSVGIQGGFSVGSGNLAGTTGFQGLGSAGFPGTILHPFAGGGGLVVPFNTLIPNSFVQPFPAIQPFPTVPGGKFLKRQRHNPWMWNPFNPFQTVSPVRIPATGFVPRIGAARSNLNPASLATGSGNRSATAWKAASSSQPQGAGTRGKRVTARVEAPRFGGVYNTLTGRQPPRRGMSRIHPQRGILSPENPHGRRVIRIR